MGLQILMYIDDLIAAHSRLSIHATNAQSLTISQFQNESDEKQFHLVYYVTPCTHVRHIQSLSQAAMQQVRKCSMSNA